MDQIFTELKSILESYEASLAVVHDKDTNYYLNTPKTADSKKAEFFGAAQIKKNYVAFHLMPVYCHPELLDDISEGLRRQMQGESCFNFKSFDTALFDELKVLTKTCFDFYKSEGKV